MVRGARAPNARRSEFTVQSDEPPHATLWSSYALQKPVVRYGPFVTNTEGQVMRAIEGFRAGKF